MNRRHRQRRSGRPRRSGRGGHALLALVLLALQGALLAAPPDEVRVRVEESSVHLRSGPGVDHEPVDKLARGEVLVVLERKGRWLHVDRQGIRGWVFATLVTEPDGPVPSAEPEPEPPALGPPPVEEPLALPPAARDRLLRTSKGDVLVEAYEPGRDYRAVLETSHGRIVLELWPEVAPNHVKNFIHLASTDFYDGLVFHRVVPGFLIQGGDPRADGTGGPGYTIALEAGDRSHEAGVVSMARRNDDPDSAGSQFFILLESRAGLDGRYSAFGAVVEGMGTVQRIAGVETNDWDQPVEPVVIEDLEVLKEPMP